MGYYDGVAFFRVIDGFVAQFGLHGHPEVNEAWRQAALPVDPVATTNARGTVTAASALAPKRGTTQLFINYVDNERLDDLGFAPLGTVEKCMENVDAIYSGYGDAQPAGRGPIQSRILEEGNIYLRQDFPELDYVITTQFLAAPVDSVTGSSEARDDGAGLDAP